jgi:hypothetical protein
MQETTSMAEQRSKKRARRAADDYADYDIQITRWSWGYHFGLSHQKQDPDGYWESRHIKVEGRVIGEVGVKYPVGEYTLIPKRDCDEDERVGKPRPKNVGFVDAYDGGLHGIFVLPNEALPAVISALVANQFRYLTIRGSRLFRRKADVWGYSLETWLDEGDLPTRRVVREPSAPR